MEPRLEVMETGLERYGFRDEYYTRQGSFSSPRKHYSTHHLPSFSASSQPSLYQANNRVRTVRREEVFIQNHRQESFKLEPQLAFMQDDNYGRQDWSHKAAVDEKQGRKWSSIRDNGGSQKPSSAQRHHSFVQEAGVKQQEARYFRSQPEQPYTYQDYNYGRQDWSHEGGGFGSSADEKQGRKWSIRATGGSPKSSNPQRHGFVQEAGVKQQEAHYFRSQPEQPYTYQVRAERGEEEMEVMDAFEAVRRHGGLLIIDYSQRK